MLPKLVQGPLSVVQPWKGGCAATIFAYMIKIAIVGVRIKNTPAKSEGGPQISRHSLFSLRVNNMVYRIVSPTRLMT